MQTTTELTLPRIREIDPEGMYDAVRDFPEQWRRGRAAALAAEVDLDMAGVQQVVLIGMGGSAIGGDLMRVVAARHARLPVFVVRHYALPAFVGRETVVIASSYSGNTEETLAALDEAEARGAKVVAVASGGEVARRAEAAGYPLVRLTGGLQPRAALGYSLTAVLTVAEKLGLFDLGAAWEETQGLLDRLAARYADLGGNPALDLARRLEDRLPFVYSENGMMEAVNVRWRCQINENAKKLAAGNVYPELNHNEIMGWEAPDDLFARIAVVELRDRGDHARVRRRMDVTRGLLEARTAEWIPVESEGESELARMMSLVHLGDWVSLYLALLRDVDPTPVGLIQQLKDTLADA